MPSPARAMRRAGGFTLVELLVVIGIIAILLSILIPTLGAARKSAAAAKCLSNLRQCGQALQLYVNENKGCVFPVRCGGGPASGTEPSQLIAQKRPYSLYNIIYGAPADVPGVSAMEAAYWMNFLSKYLTKYNLGAGDLDKQASALARNTPIWCPSWNGIEIVATDTDIQHHYTGYSMNYMVSFTPTFPNPAIINGLPPISDWLNIQLDPASPVNGPSFVKNGGGKWYHLNQIRNPAERCFLADCYYIFLEAPQTPPPQAGTFPGQRQPPSSAATIGAFNAGVQGQTTFDFYRHGSFPGQNPTAGNGDLNPKGGKVGYNILYWDGHVAKATERSEAYRSIRMRYPG